MICLIDNLYIYIYIYIVWMNLYAENKSKELHGEELSMDVLTEDDSTFH
jgi:hypothetical protein